MRKSKKADREKVFRTICKMSHNFYRISVYSSREIALNAVMPRYTVLKILHELRDDGLVEYASRGDPALSGWSLTVKARESVIFKNEAERGCSDGSSNE